MHSQFFIVIALNTNTPHCVQSSKERPSGCWYRVNDVTVDALDDVHLADVVTHEHLARLEGVLEGDHVVT